MLKGDLSSEHAWKKGEFASPSHYSNSQEFLRMPTLDENYKNIGRKQFGYLPPKYHFSLNPYPEERFSRCPGCRNKTRQLKLPLLIHVDPRNLIALNYTNRYCEHCNTLIGHKHEIEHHLTVMFSKLNPEVIGNDYLIFGTVEKEAWRENMRQQKPFNEMRHHIRDFKSYRNIRMTMTGWFRDGQEPPVVEPPPSTEWLKGK